MLLFSIVCIGIDIVLNDFGICVVVVSDCFARVLKVLGVTVAVAVAVAVVVVVVDFPVRGRAGFKKKNWWGAQGEGAAPPPAMRYIRLAPRCCFSPLFGSIFDGVICFCCGCGCGCGCRFWLL